MKKFSIVLAILATFIAVVNAYGAETFGKGVSGGPMTPISEIIADPEGFAGKNVRVEGAIVDVCRKRGCWMSIAGDKPFEALRIKVQDGVMVFPYTARGSMARVEGKLEIFKLSREEAVYRAKHHAEEQKTPFNPDDVEKYMNLMQVRATGAVIE